MTETDTTSTPEITNRTWIEDHLRSLPFVEWDRYTLGEWSAEMEYVAVYDVWSLYIEADTVPWSLKIYCDRQEEGT